MLGQNPNLQVIYSLKTRHYFPVCFPKSSFFFFFCLTKSELSLYFAETKSIRKRNRLSLPMLKVKKVWGGVCCGVTRERWSGPEEAASLVE